MYPSGLHGLSDEKSRVIEGKGKAKDHPPPLSETSEQNRIAEYEGDENPGETTLDNLCDHHHFR